MKTEINNELIRSFKPCYDPAIICEENETLSVVDWVAKYRGKLKKKEDVIWLLCQNEFMSDRDMRLFAVWCARTTYQYRTEEYPIDQRSINAVDCAERFANGQATEDELSAARDAALDAARDAAWYAARGAQIDQLITYFKNKEQ